MKKDHEKNGIFGKFAPKNKKTQVIVMIGIAGILLLLFGELFSSVGNKKSPAQTTFDENQYNNQFVANLQENLTAVLSMIEGAGAVEVLVTLETGVQYVYATNEKSTGDLSQTGVEDYAQKSTSESTIILIDGPDGKEPLVLKRIEPTVLGVVVVCQGADNAKVRESIIGTVMIICGVKSNRVSVAKMH